MSNLQTTFLNTFKKAFSERFGTSPTWIGGQVQGNFASLPVVPALHRGGKPRSGERFELGDLRADLDRWMLIIEYESAGVSTHNLLKYWPYIRGELTIPPVRPLLLCHFSDWSSWGSYRDTWGWLLSRMQADTDRRVNVIGRQFDHGGANVSSCASIDKALDWIAEQRDLVV